MYLYGAGGHAKVIMDILKENSTELTGIIDDNPHIQEWMGISCSFLRSKTNVPDTYQYRKQQHPKKYSGTIV